MALTKTQVSGLYVAIFNRASEGEGNQYWQNTGLSASEVADQMLATQDAKDYFGDSLDSDQAFIEHIYLNTLNKTLDDDPDGIAYWVNQLEDHTRGEVVESLIYAVSTYADSTDPVTKAAYDQFTNRVAVSDFMASTVQSTPDNYGTVTGYGADLVVTNDESTVTAAMLKISEMNDSSQISVIDNTFTLKKVVNETITVTSHEGDTVAYWGDPDCADCNITLSEFTSMITSVTGLSLAELGVADIDGAAALTDVTVVTSDNDSDATGDTTITYTTATGEQFTSELALGQAYLEFLDSLIYYTDADGNKISRFTTKTGDTTYTESSSFSVAPIILTTTVNNGGTYESMNGANSGAFTTDGNDLIVAGQTELLHGAYIDGGGGINTLEVDMKGVYAQPIQLLNIQNVNVQNLPNVYDDYYNLTSDNNYDGYNIPDYLDGTVTNADSILDLSRATSLEKLTITEGINLTGNSGLAIGDLTIVGVRNGAETVLQGSFTEDRVNVYYSSGAMPDGLHLTLNLGDVGDTKFGIFHTSNTVNINSIGGGNVLSSLNLDSATLTNINISGDAEFSVSDSLASNFTAGHHAVIDASANTAGVDLNVDGFADEVIFTGTANSNDHFSSIGTSESKSVTITGGNGNNEFDATAKTVTVVSGNGDNIINATSSATDATVTTGSGNDVIHASSARDLTIDAGDGNNEIDASASAVATVTAGSGDDAIKIIAPTVVLNAGDGDNSIELSSFSSAAVTTGEGDDTVKIATSSASLAFDLGAGSDTINITGNFTALEGSSITGQNISINITDDYTSNLANVALSGVTSVTLDNTATLTITADQFAALGASAFHAVDGDKATLNIVVTHDTNLNDLGDLTQLDSDISFSMSVTDGATLTLTAEQLDKYISAGGINVDDNVDNQVVVTDAGSDFDPFADSATDGITGGGTITGTTDVTVQRTINGYERPAEDSYSDALTINSDVTPVVSDVTSDATNKLIIQGAADLTMGAVDLASAFTVDFSALSGNLNGNNTLFIDNFNEITNGEQVGQIIGNGAVRVNVGLDGDLQTPDVADPNNPAAGYNDEKDNGLHSSAVSTYVVTELDGITPYNFYVCDNTQDLTTLGLQGNYDGQVNFKQVQWGVTFLMEGDGEPSYTLKANGNPAYSNVGVLTADFRWDGAPAVVNVNNQGVDTARPIHVAGIDIDSAKSITINGSDSDIVIASLDGDMVEDLTFNSQDNVTVENYTVDTVQSIDAAGVAGTFTLELATGAQDLSSVALSDVEAIVLQEGTELTLTNAQLQTIGEANVTSDAPSAINVILDGSIAFNSTNIDSDITVNVITADGTYTLDSATDLTNVADFKVSDNTTVTMDADQALQLAGATVTPGSAAATGVVNITGADQVHMDVDANADGISDFGVVIATIATAGVAGTLTITGDMNLDAATLNAAALPAAGGFTLVGSNDPDLRVNVDMSVANSFVGVDADNGVHSVGIPTYVVTQLDGLNGAQNFFVCNETHDLTTLGLQGNGGDAIAFAGVKRGVSFLMEGDGYASWADVEKNDTTWNESNIGSLTATFYTPNNPLAVVNIDNQGVGLTDSSTGGERVLVVDGVNINNVDAMTINVTDGDATITEVGSTTATTLTLNAVEDLTITNALATNLTTIDATGVTDAFTATLDDMGAAFTLTTGSNATITLHDVSADAGTVIDGTAGTLTLVDSGVSDLSLATLTSVEAVHMLEASTLTLSADQVDAIDEANISGVETAVGNANETLNIVDLGSQEIIAANLGTDVVLGNVTLADGTYTLNPNTDLSGATVTVPDGATVTMTAAQYMALADLDGVLDASGAVTSTINITGLTQADIDAGFTLANVSNAQGTVSLAESLNLDTATLGAGHITTDLNGFSVVMSDNQTLGLATSTQADGLNVSGGTTTTIEYQFIAMDGSDTQIDASGYDVDTLKAINYFVDGENVEYIIENLDSSVELRIYFDPDQLNIVQNTDRVVVVEEGVNVNGELVFNDIQDLQELTSLNLTLLGGSSITGDLRLPTITPAAAVDGRDDFGTLTINSEGTTANVITGNITAEVGAGNPAGTTEVENNLLNVVVNADQDLTIGSYNVTGDYVSGGDIVFTSNDATQAANASITLTGAGSVTLHGFDIDDSNSTGTADINALTVTNNLAGTLTVTGGSAAILGDNAESLVLAGTGDIVFGSDALGDGVESDTLSSIDASGLSGNLDLGTIIDTDDTDFSLVAGTGLTKATITGVTLNADTDGADNVLGTADDQAGFNIDMSNAAAGSELHLSGNTYTAGKLGIDLGANTTLYIDSDTDLTNVDLTLAQTQAIVLADEVTLTLTAAQANALNIVGVDTNGNGTYGTVNVVDLGTSAVDLSGIDSNIAGTVTIDATNDVTLDATTNLGDFTVGLSALDTGNTDNLSGQTIRFQTVDQADNAVTITNVVDGTPDNATVTSTNVVWLFDSVAAPVDTAGYDNDLGRLWITPALADGANVEDLFTTLPDSIIRVEFSSLTDLNVLLSSSAVERTVELVSFTDLPAGLTFSDQDILEHVHSLTIDMGGQVNVGNLSIDNVVDNTVGTVTFSELTINSGRALSSANYLAPENFVNDNDGVDETGEHVQPNNTNTVGDISVGAGNGLDLTTVTINTGDVSVVGDNSTGAGADLSVGTITFDSEVASTTATLNVSGANTTTIASLNTGDADITTLTINKTGTGALTVTGASPAAAVSNTENLIINFGESTGEASTVTLGTDNLTKPGIAGADLSLVEVIGHNAGQVANLGVISSLDGVAQVDAGGAPINSFYLDATVFNGAVTATLEADSTNTPTLADGAIWSFSNGISGTLALTISDTVSLGAGTLNFNDVDVTIDGSVNLTGLTGFTFDATSTVVVPAGSTLTMTAAEADSMIVTGAGSVVITNLEDTPAADFSAIMTGNGDTGTVEAAIDTSDADGDGNPEAIALTGANLGVAHVTVSGDGSVSVTGAMADFDRDQDAATPADTASFTVGAAATLNLTAAQADDRVADGAGTVAVADLGANAGANLDANLANITATTVTAAFNTSGTFTGDLGTAVVTIANGVDMQAAASVVSGKTITGLGTLSVDDENDGVGGAPDTAVTPDLSNVTALHIEFVPGAVIGAVTFPTLYGDDTAVPVVAPQTVTMTAAQANGQTITSAPNGGLVTVNDLGADATDLSHISANVMTANVPATATLADTTDLGTFDVVVGNGDNVVDAITLTLTAGQADGLSITEDGTDTATVAVTALEATPAANLSGIVATAETAALDANGGVALSANLGTGMTVNVSDSVVGADTVTFTGTLNPDGTGNGTTFNIAADDLTLVFDANDANLLTVTNNNPAVATAEVDTLNFTGDMTGGAISVTVGGVVVTQNFDTDEGTTLGHLAAAISAEMATQGYTVQSSVAGADVITVTGDASGADMPTIANLDVSAATGYSVGNVATTVDGVEPHSAVVVNNVDGDLVDFSGIAALTLTANVPADATLDPASNLGDFDLSLAEGVDLGMTTAQFVAVGAADITGTAGGADETLILSGYNGQALDFSALGHDVVVQTLTVLDTNTDITATGANFTNVQEIVIPDGTTLTMTAAQFMQLPTGVVSGAGTLNLTDFGDANAAIDLSHVTAQAGTITLDSGDTTFVLDAAANLGDFGFDMSADNQSLTFSTETQADHRVVNDTVGGTNYTGTTVVLGFTSADATDADAVIDCANYTVDNVWLISEYLHNEFGLNSTPANFEAILDNLSGATLVTVYDADTLLASSTVSPQTVTSHNRTVTIDSDTTVSADVAFDDIHPDSEVANVTLNLQGNSVITGNLTLEQQLDPHSTNPVTVPEFFKVLTINSTDTTVGGTAANQIQGNIFADDGTDGAGSESEVETFTLTLDAAISIVGSAEQLSFEGTVVNFANGDNTDAVGAKIAAASYDNWTTTYDAATDTVTFVNKNVGDVTNAAISDFTFNSNDAATTGFPGTASVNTTQQGIFQAEENNLYNVVINADHDLNIGGELEMSYVTRSNATNDETVVATLDLNDIGAGGAKITVGAINTNDDHISGLVIDTVGFTGNLDPVLHMDNTETLTITDKDSGTSTVGGTVAFTEVEGDELSSITIDADDAVTLVLSQIDSNDDTGNDAFTYTAGTGVQNITVAAVGANTPTLDAGSTWNFDFTGAAVGSTLTLSDTIVFGAGATLSLDDVALVIDGNVDFSAINLEMTGTTSISVAAGQTLTMTPAQADGMAITGDGTVVLTGDYEHSTPTHTNPDLSGIIVSTLDASAVTDSDIDDAQDATDTVNTTGITYAPNANTVDMTVIGSAFNDTITTSAGADVVNAGAGNDTITGGTGADTLNGEAGDDIIVAEDTDTLVDGGADNDTVRYASAVAAANLADADLSNVENVEITNTGDAAYDFSNQVEGLNIIGNTGADTITGGAGNDTITGGAGADLLDGGAGDDTLVIDDADTSIVGGADTDTVELAADVDVSADTMTGVENVTATAEGADLTIALAQLAQITGTVTGDNTDTLNNDEQLIVTGTAGDDTIDVSTITYIDAAATVNGGAGIDTITGGTGADTLNGEAGNDIIIAQDTDALVDGGADTDTVRYAAAVNAANLADAGLVNVEHVEVTNASDAAYDFSNQTENLDITGGGAADTITGGTAADTINGGAGDDVLHGDAGDTLTGGLGNDTFQIDTGAVAVADLSGADILAVENTATAVVAAVTADWTATAATHNLSGAAGSATLNIADGVTVNLSSATVATAATDGFYATYSGATTTFNFTGSAGDDRLDLAAIHSLSGVPYTIDGGTGADTLNIVNGTHADQLDGVTNFETININNTDYTNSNHGAGYVLGVDTLVAAGQTVTINHTGVGGSVLNIDLSAETDGHFIINDFTAQVDPDDDTTGVKDTLTVIGGGLSDTITGSGFTDHIDGGAGADVLDGGAGDDTLVIDDADTVINGGGDVDTVEFATNIDITSDTMTNVEVLTATTDGISFTMDSADLATNALTNFNGVAGGVDEQLVVNGTAGVDAIDISGITFANAGANLNGGAGADVITGSNGDDHIDGGTGSDTIDGGAGDDVIDGGADADSLTGGAGDDIITAEDTDTLVDGGADNDTVKYGSAVSALNLQDADLLNVELIEITNTGNATYDFSAQSDGFTINGNTGNDTIAGSSAADTINGGAGDDVFLADTAAHLNADTLNGGTGANKIVLSADGLTIADADLANKTDIQTLETANGVNSVTFAGNANTAGITTVYGGSGNDTIDLSNAAYTLDATLWGNNGNNTLTGGSGADHIVSDTSGADTLTGNNGSDTFTVQGSGTANITDLTNGDVLSILTGAGNVTAALTGTFIATGDTVHQVGSGTATINMATSGLGLDMSASGGTLGWILNGSTAGDTIIGSGNDDTITGGAGDDSMSGGNGNDTFNIAFGGEGQDTISDFTASGADDSIDFTGASDVANVTNAGSLQAVTASAGDGTTTTANSGLVIVSSNDAVSLSTTDVANYLADLNQNGTATDGLVFENNGGNSVIYIAVDDGTDTAIFKADANGNGDTVIDAGELTLVATLTGIADAGTLDAADFADFA